MFHAARITGKCQNADGEVKSDGVPLYGRPTTPISTVSVIFFTQQLDTVAFLHASPARYREQKRD